LHFADFNSNYPRPVQMKAHPSAIPTDPRASKATGVGKINELPRYVGLRETPLKHYMELIRIVGYSLQQPAGGAP
jgi:hypothetical protein